MTALFVAKIPRPNEVRFQVRGNLPDDEKYVSKLGETFNHYKKYVSKLGETFNHYKKYVSPSLETFKTTKNTFPSAWKPS
jgi:ribosomal protein S17E